MQQLNMEKLQLIVASLANVIKLMQNHMQEAFKNNMQVQESIQNWNIAL